MSDKQQRYKRLIGAGALLVDIKDASEVTVGSPSVAMISSSTSPAHQTSTPAGTYTISLTKTVVAQ